jgi:hypothetical protein
MKKILELHGNQVENEYPGGDEKGFVFSLDMLCWILLLNLNPPQAKIPDDLWIYNDSQVVS